MRCVVAIGPLQLGAIMGEASRNFLDQIEIIGEKMGIAFQIQDDIIGIYGNSAIIGKPNLSDMREGKKTILTYHFINNASSTQLDIFNKIYGCSNSTENELEQLRCLFREVGSLNYAKTICQEYVDEAKLVIEKFEVDDKNKRILFSFLEYLCERNS